MGETDISKARVLVVGDLMLDRYYYGGVTRISPEAPVPVVSVESESAALGGAGNVASNIAGLGVHCHIIGSCGKDEGGTLLAKLLKDIKVGSTLIDMGTPTTTKMRIIGDKQQIARLDFEEAKEISEEYSAIFKENIKKRLEEADTVVISDYGKGVCSFDLCRFLINEARKSGKYVIVDPKGPDWSKYQGASIVTPNVKELQEAAGAKIPNADEYITQAGQKLRKKYGMEYLVVTRSEKGISVISSDGTKHIPTQAREVFDVSGAGDTVVATTAAFLAAGGLLEEAVAIANTAAGIVVGKSGTVPIKYHELAYALNCMGNSKLISWERLISIAESEKAAGKKIVFTNGCFDILHRGHVSYLKKARSLGDMLILGLNSDASVRRLKGPGRPVNREEDRAEVLSGLESVDYITVFGEDTPLEIIKLIRPNVLVKGGDYEPSQVAGGQYAGRVEIIDFLEGFSTTDTIKKINGGNG